MNAYRREGGRSAADPFSDLFDAWMSVVSLLAGAGEQRPATVLMDELFRVLAAMFAPGSGAGTSGTGSAAESPRPGSDPRAGARAGRADPSQGLEQVFEMMASWAQFWAQWVSQADSKTPPTTAPQRPDKFAGLAAQGYTVCLASYIRYLRRAADIWGQYCKTTAGQVDETGRDRSTQESPAFDECAAALREASERFLREARLEARAVQQQLLDLAREASTVDDKPDERRRYAKAKP
jgi:hypothetical protein